MSNYFFEGARADLSKVVSPNPAFQITHSFQLGQKSNYTLGTVFANANTFLHGQWDPSTGGVNMRANQTWSASDITKIQGQVSGCGCGARSWRDNSCCRATAHSRSRHGSR